MKKWLLDHNLPMQVAEFLKTQGIDCSWTSAEGWQQLSNGELVRAATSAGYGCLLTNDRKFAHSAGNALSKNPNFAVVEITLAQAPKDKFLSAFEEAWKKTTIQPEISRVVKWPRSEVQ